MNLLQAYPKRMRHFYHPWIAAGLILAFQAGFFPVSASANSTVDNERVAAAVARLLESNHYSRRKLDAELSREFFDNYLRNLDYNKMYFTQEDVEEFRGKYGERLHDFILRGDLSPAYEIHDRFRQRVEDRVEKNKKLTAQEYDFKSDRTFQLNRQKVDWPANMQEADNLWQDRVEAELLQEHLNETRIDPPEKVVTRRYDQVLRNLREEANEDVLKKFLSALANTYDPHSEYLSPSDMENFAISMRLSLVGVGAVLRSEDGYAKIMEVVAGGPADRDGRLKVNDRIAAVAQGDEPFEDVVDMRLDKVVEKIRGKKGTTVRLSVIPANATDPSKRDVVEIVRDEVELKDAEAKAELIDVVPEAGKSTRIGWITLPTFYSDMDRKGGKKGKSTTEDVKILLERLKREGMEGLVIDLRKDGGGSLEEAINMTGLFIGRGPVVQSKDAFGKVTVNYHNDSKVAWDGPVIVLVNRLSASASEIFAAALQDYDRAVIVGDERSFGKGTVQTLYDVGRVMAPFFSLNAVNAGAVKVTIQKFYRVKGGSTQLLGVEPDIVLPSLTDQSEIGESALHNPLPHDRVTMVKFNPSNSVSQLLEELGERSSQRVQNDPEFAYILEDKGRLQERLESNQLSLNKQERKTERKEEETRRELRKKERKDRGPTLPAVAYSVTLDEAVNAETLLPVSLVKKPKPVEDAVLAEELGIEVDEDEEKIDPIKDETVRIMGDLIQIKSASVPAGKTASVQTDSGETQKAVE